MRIIPYFLIFFLLLCTLHGEEGTYLRDNLRKANSGDFIVTAQGQSYTLLHIYDKSDNKMVIEEITIPKNRMPHGKYLWRGWVKEEAPFHSSWVMYEIDLNTGKIGDYFSFSKNAWYDMPEADNILSKLLNLHLKPIPYTQRKKLGGRPTTASSLWQPPMVVDGRKIEGVAFDAWRTSWPKDGSDLSGKMIEVYVPQENDKYPSYFPYWLQVSGFIGKAKIRIIDSGTKLISPKPPLPRRNKGTA